MTTKETQTSNQSPLTQEPNLPSFLNKQKTISLSNQESTSSHERWHRIRQFLIRGLHTRWPQLVVVVFGLVCISIGFSYVYSVPDSIMVEADEEKMSTAVEAYNSSESSEAERVSNALEKVISPIDKEYSEQTQTITVDVEGAVMSPGVVTLQPGARVADAIVAAGGLSKQAHARYVQRMINQSSPVGDAEKIYIPYLDEVVDAPPGMASQEEMSQQVTDQPTDNQEVNNTTSSQGVSINEASVEELDALPGIGQSRAEAIIKGRPYASIEDLRTRKVVTASVYDQIESLISL